MFKHFLLIKLLFKMEKWDEEWGYPPWPNVIVKSEVKGEVSVFQRVYVCLEHVNKAS